MFQRSHRSTAWLALMLTVGGCAAVVCPLANRLDAERGLALALLACVVCLTTCLITVELFFRFQSPDTAYVLALLGQLIRMAIPSGAVCSHLADRRPGTGQNPRHLFCHCLPCGTRSRDLVVR